MNDEQKMPVSYLATESECPWPVRPTTAAGMLESCRAMLAWEAEHCQGAPRLWHVVPTTTAFVDMLEILLGEGDRR